MLGEVLVSFHEQLLGRAASPPSSEGKGPLTYESHASRLDVTSTELLGILAQGAPSPRDRDRNIGSAARIDINGGISR